MKKWLASISFVCYFILTTGFVVNRHYCMERLASVHFFETGTDVCGLCGMETHESNGCCRDEVTVVKLALDQTAPATETVSIPSFEFQPVFFQSYLVAPVIKAASSKHFHNHSPPLLSEQDIYLRNNIFRI